MGLIAASSYLVDSLGGGVEVAVGVWASDEADQRLDLPVAKESVSISVLKESPRLTFGRYRPSCMDGVTAVRRSATSDLPSITTAC